MIRMHSAISREDRACLLLALGRLSSSENEEVNSLLSTPLQWEKILERSLQHEVYPLVVRNLKACGFPGVPGQVRSRLQTLFQMNALRNDLLAEELAVVLRILHEAGIPVIPLKGIPLAESLYGDKSLRVCSDIDVLVPRQNVEQSFNLLVASGYRADFPRWVLRESMMRNSIECALRRKEQAMEFLLELHWSLLLEASNSEGSMQTSWVESHPDVFRGVPMYVLSPESELLFLMVHAARHQWQGLKWLVDIHQICVTQGLNWKMVVEKASKLGLERLVQWGLSVCNAVLDTPLPKDLPCELPQPHPRLFPAPPAALNSWQNYLHVLRLARRPSEKFRPLARRLFVPTLAEYSLWPLPASLAILYYPIRLLRITYLMGRAIMNNAFSGH